MPGEVVAKSTVWLERGGTYLLGHQEAQLLEAIDRTGSIKEAARAIGLSYRTAWARIQTIESALGQPMVRSRAGGPGGGATSLTPEGRDLVRVLLEVSKKVEGRVEQEYRSALPPQV